MISDTRRLIGSVRVEETDKLIKVSGIPSRLMSSDIQRIWGTTRISKHMFTRIGRSDMIFYRFYALEVFYALGELEKEPSAQTSVRTLRYIKKKLLEETWLRNTQKETEPFLDRRAVRALNLTLLDHQERFLDTFEQKTQQYNLNGYLLAGAPGSGKTITGLSLALALKADKVIVVSPKNAIYKVWEKTLKTNFRKPPTYWVSGDGKPIDPKVDYHIFHYESLEKALLLASRLRARRPVIILDESHNFNELGAVRTQRFIDLCERFNNPTVLWASGTPIKALGGEMVPFLRTIDPLFTEDTQEGFTRIFGRSKGYASDILANRLGEVTFKVGKREYSEANIEEHDHCVTIPNGNDYTLSSIKKDMRIFIEQRVQHYTEYRKKYEADFFDALKWFEENEVVSSADEREYREYQRALTEIIKHYDPYKMKDEAKFCNHYELTVIAPTLPTRKMREDFKNARSVVKYVNLKIQGEALGRLLGRKRTECHLDMVEYVGLEKIILNSKKKTVIFTSYVEVADKAFSYLKSKGFKPLIVHGSTGEDLNKTVSEFETKFDANPMIATFKSLSTAVPLIVANTVVNLNAPFRDYEYQQAISRVDRLGQDTRVEIFNVILDTGEEVNISSRNKDILSWSKEQVAKLMGTDVDVNPEISIERMEVSFEEKKVVPKVKATFASQW